jgi:hypothetical protein
MLLNPLLAQMLAEERVKDALREAEQARLVREAQQARAANHPASAGLLVKVRDLALRLASLSRVKPDVELGKSPA